MYEKTTELTDEVSSRASEDAPAPDVSPKKPRRVGRIVITAVLSAVTLVLLLAVGAVVFGTNPHAVEVGCEIYHPASALPFCEVVTDLHSIDESKLGEHTVKLRFFGFLTLDSTLTVRDTVPPSVTVRELYAADGTNVAPEDLIVSAVDKTALTFSFTEISDGIQGICATDEGGNETVVPYKLTYTDKLIFDDIELGSDESELYETLSTVDGLEVPDITDVNLAVCGTYRVSGSYSGTDCIFTVTVTDTTAPTAKVRSFDILLGQTLSAKELVTDITDASEVKVYYEAEPTFDKAGSQSITVILEDTSGNTSRYTAKLNIHNITSTIVIEAGTPTDEFKSQIRELLGTGAPLPRVSDNFETEHLSVGTHVTELVGEYSVIPLEIIVEDTTPPELILKKVSVLTGNMPSVTDFVAGCIDESGVKLSFVSEPDVLREGNFLVTIAAVDNSGNRSEASTVLRVTKDDVPPTIYGTRSISVYEGESISYRSGVWAMDEKDGKVTVKVDTSRVKANVAGTYYVTYTAVDSDGNVASITTTVTIKPINTQAVNALADEVLSTIIKKSMTDRQKARAIYDWCRENLKYSTTTSHLMGYFNKAAYSGFTKHYGNCYTYYAVASALLTRAGIYNIEIQRNDPDNPHYWNLVKMDGKWYHLDTCPQPSPHKLEVFLLTDKQVRAFELDYYYDFNAANYPATP